MTDKTMTFEALEDYVAACVLLVETSTANFHGYRKDGFWIIEFTGGF